MRPADGAYLPTGLVLAGVFVTRRTAPAPAPDWSRLPDLAGRVGLVSPVASGTAYPVMSAMIEAAGGVAAGHDLLLALRSRGLGVAASNPLLLGQIHNGDVALGKLPSEAAYAMARREAGLRVTVPHPAGLVPAVIGISARAPPAARRRRCASSRFLLTSEGQRLVRQSTAEGLAWPVIAGAAPPPGLPPLADLALVHPDPEAWGAREGEEVGWFPPGDRAVSAARAMMSVSVLAALLVTYPLLRFLLLPLLPGFGSPVVPPSGDGPGLGLAFANSARLATLSAACALPPSIWLGMMLERRSWQGRRVLLAALWLLFLIPGYLVAAGWEILLGTQALRSVPWWRDALLGWPGLVGLTALKGLPVATLAARAAWLARQTRIEEAARIHVRSAGRRALLMAQPMLPFAATAFLIVFIEATQDYGLAATFGARLHLPLLGTEVYASLANWPISWPRAARASDLLVLLALLPVAVRMAFPVSMRMPAGHAAAPPRPASGPERRLGQLAGAALLCIGGGVPLLAARGRDRLVRHHPAAGRGLAGAARLVALQLRRRRCRPVPRLRPRGAAGRHASARLAHLAAGREHGRAGHRARRGLRDRVQRTAARAHRHAVRPAACRDRNATSHAGPVSAAPMRATLGHGDAARVHGIGLEDRIGRIHLPLLARPLAWAGSLAFCRLFFELPLAQMLAPAGGEPVGVVLVQLQQSLHFAAEARLALLAMLLCGTIVCVVLIAVERRR